MKSPADNGGMEDILNIFRFLLENSGQNDLRLVLVGSFFFFSFCLPPLGITGIPNGRKEFVSSCWLSQNACPWIVHKKCDQLRPSLFNVVILSPDGFSFTVTCICGKHLKSW